MEVSPDSSLRLVDLGAIDHHVAGGGDAEADLVNQFSEKSRGVIFRWFRKWTTSERRDFHSFGK